MGDGTLVDFASIVGTVRAAVEVPGSDNRTQRTLKFSLS